MANLRVTITARTPLPVSVRDLPKLERLITTAADAHGVKHSEITMAQDGADLVLSYEVNAR